MVIDNFEKLNKLLTFETEDDFYMLQILKRRKENPDMDKNSVALKTVYLHRENQLLDLKDDLIDIAQKNNARIYLNPNRKSFKKCTLGCLKEFANRIEAENYYKPYKVFDAVAGSCGSKKAVWVIDIDWKEIEGVNVESEFERKLYVNKVCEMVNIVEPHVDNKVLLINPTKNGVHILTTPFNVANFSATYHMPVHKNNPTLVWCGQ
jgi:hypothetical protein